ncbi:protein kinase domain-containing protein [Streptomyces antimicrobicus]|uniref:non-specific serine/threonine protein kinase n=1 Tax=Streptomyces antimicrobicus TaxID=2883108 RepID=A0ABS8B5H1_9ACTN|nr:protein kinase [Streptomyces antimicrobicus]MCB5179861.1 protein kinase [Streptomyces antimicrobicus]
MSQDGTQGRYAGGSLAGGRYQLRDLLGEGGMASVYLAYDSALDRQVAIKTLHSELGREQSFRERFRREAQAVAKLSHTNIVSVFDTGEGELDGALMPYIVMEYVEGKPLGSVLQADIAQYGAMPADKALKVTSDVLAALETSHEMGLVHRDIKPGNVMMTKRGVVKVMDFGIARAMQSGVTSMTQTGMVVGTPQYLSPEQALGRAVDARSDLYSVGIMLFQLLTGRLPFDADSPLAIAYAHVQEEPVAPSSVNRSLTPAMDALVARALKKNPNERFPTAAAMRDEIARVLSAGQTASPVIVAGAPVGSGAGVGSAVFPPLDASQQGTQQGVQQPYQPTPTPSPYGPPTPAPHAGPQGGYAYPPQQQPHTPPPVPHQQFGQQAPQTPAPFTISPTQTQSASSGGGPRRNNSVVLGAIVVALLAIGGLITAIVISNKGDEGGKGGTAGGGSNSAAPSNGAGTGSSAKAGHKGPDPSRTIEASKCKEAYKSYKDPNKVSAPDFRYKNLTSVKECLQAAGWRYKIQERDEAVYGQDMVLEQLPAPSTDVDKSGTEFTLVVSTGNPQ